MAWQRHPGLPLAQGSVPAGHVWPRTAFVPGPQGTGILPDHRCRLQAPSPRQSSGAARAEEGGEQLLLAPSVLLFGAFQNNPAEFRTAAIQQSGFPKTEGKFCMRSGEGRLTGTCNPSLAETANCF